MTTAYLNGEFLPLDQIKISSMDRGFLFGDGVYEVIPVYKQNPFRLAEHLQRLMHSLAAIKLMISYTTEDLINVIQELIIRNPSDQQSVYLQFTRGIAMVREHKFPTQSHPTLFAFSIPMSTSTLTELSQGIRVITAPDIRWHRCDIKSVNLLANILIKQQAIEAGAQDAILIRDGYALEATAASLFIVKDNLLITPPESQYLLGSITADVILEIAARERYSWKKTAISEAMLRNADEIWLASSTTDIVPVIALDNKPISTGKPGTKWLQMMQHYQAFKQTLNSLA